MPKRTDLESILIIGSGPIVIGQACEFDYSGTQACRVLGQEGYRVVLANSNPATIMTDPDFADRTYLEPLTPDVLERIIERERPDAVLPTLGGQTGLNLAMALYERGVVGVPGAPELIGANAEAIATAEDRERFKAAMVEIGLEVPAERHRPHGRGGAGDRGRPSACPVIVRPAYILGGRGTGIAATIDELERIAAEGSAASPIDGDPHRGVDRRVEGVRARGHAGPRRQLRRDLLDREPGSDGDPHRRLDHGRAGADPLRCRVPAHARRRVRLHPPRRGGDGRLQRPVRGGPEPTAARSSSR